MGRRFYFFIFFVFLVSTNSTGQAIKTIAGGMQAGYSGDGGPGTAAELDEPAGIAVDGSGNVYFGDELNYRVRKIDASGIITTFAGNGIYGFGGAHIQATACELYYPQQIAVDNSGNVYICDDGPVIRKVDPATGVASFAAGNGGNGFSGDGGPATRAKLLNPTGIAVDNKGNLYISDYGNYRIRKVDTAGIITTIAGTGGVGYYGDGGPALSATFGNIYGLAVDLAGNVYVADAGSECVRKIDKTTGKITSVAGNHFGAGTLSGGYGGDGGPATDAEFNYAKYIAVDNNGNLYIADLNNQRVRMVDTSGIINTIAGNGIPGYNGDGDDPASRELYDPKGVAADANGNVYIAEKSNNRIRFMTRSSVSVKTLSSTGEMPTVFPNPATNEISINTGRMIYYSLTIFNSIGQIVSERGINSTITKVNIESLAPGFYTIILKGKSGTSISKFVKM